ncbi:hypothetical protein A2U01_0077791, partial [Trifolium medium]|nr:hypothetical protein [Trifolium medium]
EGEEDEDGGFGVEGLPGDELEVAEEEEEEEAEEDEAELEEEEDGVEDEVGGLCGVEGP